MKENSLCEFVHTVLEVKKSYNMLSASWRASKVGAVA
jgi:hypothetical protein